MQFGQRRGIAALDQGQRTQGIELVGGLAFARLRHLDFVDLELHFAEITAAEFAFHAGAVFQAQDAGTADQTQIALAGADDVEAAVDFTLHEQILELPAVAAEFGDEQDAGLAGQFHEASGFQTGNQEAAVGFFHHGLGFVGGERHQPQRREGDQQNQRRGYPEHRLE